jgi:hypothetical protein
MPTVPGAEFSTCPPTVALVALAAMVRAAGLLQTLQAAGWSVRQPGCNRADQRLHHDDFLWHPPADAARRGCSRPGGSVSDSSRRSRWMLRPVWMLAMPLVLLPVAALLGRFEREDAAAVPEWARLQRGGRSPVRCSSVSGSRYSLRTG